MPCFYSLTNWIDETTNTAYALKEVLTAWECGAITSEMAKVRNQNPPNDVLIIFVFLYWHWTLTSSFSMFVIVPFQKFVCNIRGRLPSLSIVASFFLNSYASTLDQSARVKACHMIYLLHQCKTSEQAPSPPSSQEQPFNSFFPERYDLYQWYIT